MGLINAQRLPSGSSIDPQKLQHIQSLQAQLQREYREAGLVQGAQPDTSMGQQQGIVTGQETMIMSQPRMVNAQMQQQTQGGLRQVTKCLIIFMLLLLRDFVWWNNLSLNFKHVESVYRYYSINNNHNSSAKWLLGQLCSRE